MSEHTPSFIMLGALALFLSAVIVLRLMGATAGDDAMHTLTDAAIAMGSAIAGYSMPRPK